MNPSQSETMDGKAGEEECFNFNLTNPFVGRVAFCPNPKAIIQKSI